jgi:hypothetical protein
VRQVIAATTVLLFITAPARPAAAGGGQASSSPPALPAEQPSAARITYDYSTAPLWRNAALSDAAWAAFNLGMDWGLDALTRDRWTARSPAGVAGRAARWVLLARDFRKSDIFSFIYR